MLTVPVLLMIVALVLFGIAAWPRNYIAAGLFCVTLAQLWPLVR
jgi:hypothetical protein